MIGVMGDPADIARTMQIVLAAQAALVLLALVIAVQLCRLARLLRALNRHFQAILADL